MKQHKNLAILSLAALAGLFACKAKNNSELSSYEFRSGERWVVIGMKPGDTNVSFRECSRDEVLKIGNSNLTLDSCPRPKSGDSFIFDDMPFAAYRMIFSEQFKIDAGEMKQWEGNRKLAKVYYDGYMASIKSAKTDEERENAEREAKAQKAVIDNADRYIESHNIREAYVEKVMKFVLPSPEGDDTVSLETHKLITSGETGINEGVLLIDELTYPFQKWAKSVLNPETKARLDVLRKQNKNDYTSEFLDNIAAAENTMGSSGGWIPRADKALTSTANDWVKTDWLEANRYCNANNYYSMPSKRELAAWYVYLKVRGTPAAAFPPEGNKDEGYIWVRDDLKFDTNQVQEMKPRSGTGDFHLASINNLSDSLVGKVLFSDNGVIGTAVAFSPSTGKYFSAEMFYNTGAPSQKAWKLCAPYDSKVPAITRDQFGGVTMCALKFTTVIGNTYRKVAKMKYGKNQYEITRSLQTDCNELREKKISRDASNASCEIQCEAFDTWVNPPKEPKR